MGPVENYALYTSRQMHTPSASFGATRATLAPGRLAPQRQPRAAAQAMPRAMRCRGAAHGAVAGRADAGSAVPCEAEFRVSVTNLV